MPHRDELGAHKRHVSDDQCPMCPTPYRSRVVDDVLERDGNGRLVSLYDIAERIADEQNVHAGLIENARHKRIVSGQADDLGALRFHFQQPACRHGTSFGWLML